MSEAEPVSIPPPPPATPVPLVQFHYIKGNHFRVLHTSGMIGSPSFDGLGVRMVLYTERVPIPLLQSWEADANGELLKQVNSIGRQGVVREVEAEVIMSTEVARAMGQWLIEQADEADKQKSSIAAIAVSKVRIDTKVQK